MRVLVLAALATAGARPKAIFTTPIKRADEGYLFVTNRGDEAVFSARSVRAVDRHANITFISDAATLRDVGRDLGVFDVVIEAGKAMPDIATHSSQGFRLQKLRGGLVSPYERTIYMDSDTYSCQNPGKTLFPLLSGPNAPDVAMVFGGRGNHTGASAGVLSFRKSPASDALWRAWEKIYRAIMHHTRREQPAFQRALASAIRTHGLVARKLPMTYNCRNVRHCRKAVLKDRTVAADGCVVVHAHDFEAELYKRANAVAIKASSYQVPHDDACPAVKSGAHRLIVLAAPPQAAPATGRRFVFEPAPSRRA